MHDASSVKALVIDMRRDHSLDDISAHLEPTAFDHVSECLPRPDHYFANFPTHLPREAEAFGYWRSVRGRRL